MNWESVRLEMVNQQLRARGIRDAAVLRAMETIPRHQFVPPSEEARAYNDSPLEIGNGQTISQPFIVAYMTELLQVSPHHRILEIGTGCGYQTAILATLAAEVFTLEIHPQLQDAARDRLAALGFTNIHFDIGDGHFGWPEIAPFDRIMVTAGALKLPPVLVDQLAPSGRMVIPVGPRLEDQMLKLITKTDSFRVDIRDTVPVRFVPLLHHPEEPQES